MDVCRKCGAALRDTDKFCSQCGTRVPSASARKRQAKAQKKKQQKEITFRTKPEKGNNYRENFEEGENRSRALRVTVTILALMMLAVAGFAMYYFFSGSKPSSETAAVSGSAAIQILSEGQAVSESTAPASGAAQNGEGAQDAENNADAPVIVEEGSQEEKQPDTGTAPAEAPQTEQTPQTEEQTEPKTEPQTDPPAPVAAEVIDVSQIQSILATKSNATSAEVYIYDLKHDSEVAVNDCTEQLRLSALITVPILYTAASRIDSGELTPETEITYVTTLGGRGEITTESREGLAFPLSFYLQTMVRYSDNNCINILIDFLGLDSINAVCQDAGYSTIWMERGLVAAGNSGGLDNYGSARDISLMVRDLYMGKFSYIGTDFMKEYFRISESDSLPTLIALAPSLADASLFLNQNASIDTRYIETAVIEDNGSEYILTIMLSCDESLVYSPAVQDISEYVSSVMTP